MDNEILRDLSFNIILLGIVSFITDASSDMIWPILPMFITAIGGMGLAVGLIGGLGEGVAGILQVFSGYWSDKFGIKVLAVPFLLSLFPPLLTMVDAELSTPIVASIFFGLVLGMQESIYRAAVFRTHTNFFKRHSIRRIQHSLRCQLPHQRRSIWFTDGFKATLHHSNVLRSNNANYSNSFITQYSLRIKKNNLSNLPSVYLKW